MCQGLTLKGKETYNMDISTFLKENNTRLEMGGKWLVWALDEWLVLERPFRKKSNRCLYSGDNIEEALQALKNEV